MNPQSANARSVSGVIGRTMTLTFFLFAMHSSFDSFVTRRKQKGRQRSGRRP
jgi:hypothetical protein